MRSKYSYLSLFFSAILLISSFHSSAQESWTEPLLISDTLTDNRNTALYWTTWYGGEDYYFFWEKKIDDSTTAIYGRRYYTPEEPVEILHSPGVKYSNVQMIEHYPAQDTAFVLFYQSDENGKEDIFYRFYITGGFSEPFTLSEAAGDDEHLRANNDRSLVWERNDSIFHVILETGNQPGPVDIIDTNGRNPVIIESYGWSGIQTVAWEKLVNDSSHIYLSEYDGWAPSWSEPILVSDSGNNTGLRFCASLFDMNVENLTWDHHGIFGHSVHVYDIFEETLYELEFHQEAPTSPDLFAYDIPLSEWIEAAFLVYLREENDTLQVVGNEGWFSVDPGSYSPVSGSALPKYNPRLFEGDHYGNCFNDVICIWEEEANGMRQLWTSYYPLCLFGSVDEKAYNPLRLSVSPNPADEVAHIRFESPGPATFMIRVFNPAGQPVSTYNHDTHHRGQVDFSMNTGDLVPGIYLLEVSDGKRGSSAKLLIQR